MMTMFYIEYPQHYFTDHGESLEISTWRKWQSVLLEVTSIVVEPRLETGDDFLHIDIKQPASHISQRQKI